MSSIKAYNGGAFIDATPKVWNGSAWIEPVIKYWDGSQWVEISNVPLVPAGLIVPLNSTSIPTDWTRFSAADGKFIIAAGDTYAVAATGGQTQVVVATESQADHTGSTEWVLNSAYTGDGEVSFESASGPGSAAGGHSHNATINFTPENQQIVLIKSDKNLNEFPANAVVLTKANVNPGSLAGCFTDNKYLVSGASVTTNAQVLSVSSISDAGDHRHLSYSTENDGKLGSQNQPDNSLAGEHDHNDTINFLTLSSDDIKKAYLQAWTDTNAFTDAIDIIAMWEGSTAPDGWHLCDGTDSTLDLRNYFIKLSDTTNVGSRSGDNTVDINGETANDGAHDHIYTTSAQRDGSITQIYHSTNSDHKHDLSGADSYLPEYYALTFIIYTG